LAHIDRPSRYDLTGQAINPGPSGAMLLAPLALS